MKQLARTLVVAAALALGEANVGLAQSRPATEPATRAQSRPAERTTRPRLSTSTTSAAATSASAPASQPSLAAARKLYWTGQYDKSAQMYRHLLGPPTELTGDDAVAAAVGLAETLAMVGRHNEAVAALKSRQAPGERDAEWRVAMSELLSAKGDHAAALEQAQAARQLRPDWAPAVLRLGQCLETFGRKKEAIEVYKSADKALDARGFRKDAAALTAMGQIMDRHSVLIGQRASNQAQNIYNNYFFAALRDGDRQHWPARVAAAFFFLSKHKGNEAKAELDEAEKLNRRLPEVAMGRALIELGGYQFEKAIAQANIALGINPNLTEAHLLKAYALVLWRKFDQARPHLDKALAINPNHLEALGMLAALEARLGRQGPLDQAIARVNAVNPCYGEMYDLAGEWLAAARQFDQAEAYYKRAAEASPELADPLCNLGLLYMQNGQEELARKTLDAAFQKDDFRADVKNYLDLLDRLAKFKVKETAHFILKVDQQDEVLLDWLAQVAESIHDEVSKDFAHSPAQKTLVEMFPDHPGFSVRITGRGWIGTVGACTGRVIAMPAPDPLRGGFGSFNWAVVLRHEYTHAVTLALTQNRIPHWFTEACAVWEQPDRRNFQAVALLVEATRDGRLLPVKSLDWGFVRPSRPGERELAYAQSEWIFEYVVEKKGYPTILAMLEGFGDRKSQAQIFQELLGCSEEQFDADFRTWAGQQVRQWGFDMEPVPELDKASKRARTEPNSAEAQANLAAALLRARRVREAEAAARKALAIDGENKRALAVLGSALAAQDKHEEAVIIAERLEGVDPRSAAAARIQAQCHLTKRRWPQALAALERYKQYLPFDSYSYEQLQNLYLQLGQTEQALPNLVELHRRTMKDTQYARQAADLYRPTDPDKAMEMYEQVIQINPYDAGVYRALAGVSLRVRRNDLALLALSSVCLLEPKSAEAYAQLAAARLRLAIAEKSAARLAEARSAAQKSIDLDAAGPGQQVLDMIERTKLD